MLLSGLPCLPPCLGSGKAARGEVGGRERRRKCQSPTQKWPRQSCYSNTKHLAHRSLRGQVCRDKRNNRLVRMPNTGSQVVAAESSSSVLNPPRSLPITSPRQSKEKDLKGTNRTLWSIRAWHFILSAPFANGWGAKRGQQNRSETLVCKEFWIYKNQNHVPDSRKISHYRIIKTCPDEDIDPKR